MAVQDSFSGNLLNEDFILSLYDPERRPFDDASQLGDSPQAALPAFLGSNGPRTTTEKPQCPTAFLVHKSRLRAIQKAELALLERNTCGVHYAIAVLMRGPNRDDEATKNFLISVLIPEWRKHLDDFVDRNNALIRFDMAIRRETQFEQEYDQYMSDRKETIHEMVIFVVQKLHAIKEEVDRKMDDDRSDPSESVADSTSATLLGTSSCLFAGDSDSDNDSIYTLPSAISSTSDESSTFSIDSDWEPESELDRFSECLSPAPDHIPTTGPSFIFPKL